MITYPDEPISPCRDWVNYPTYGLTKREYMATAILQGLITGAKASGASLNIKELTKSAIMITEDFINVLNDNHDTNGSKI